MNPVYIAELTPDVRARVLKQIEETEGSASPRQTEQGYTVSTSLAVQQSAVQSIQKPSLDTMSSGSHKDREAHGRALAEKFVNGLSKTIVHFINELAAEIIEVRQDFAVKPKAELICGVATFTEYCTAVLGYSIRHIDRILEGNNPTLSAAENAEARQRKAKRELDAKVKRTQNALPIRPKTNAEILADKAEEKTIDALKKEVTALTHKLQVTSMKPPPAAVSVLVEKDIQKIHANEMKQLDTEISKLKGSLQKLTVAYETLRSDAGNLATLCTRVESTNANSIVTVCRCAEKFLKKHGEGVMA